MESSPCLSTRNYFCRNIVLPNSSFFIDYSKSPQHGQTLFAYVFGGSDFNVTTKNNEGSVLSCGAESTEAEGASLWDFSAVGGMMNYSEPDKSGSVLVENNGSDCLYIISFNPVDSARKWKRSLVFNETINSENQLSYIGFILPVIGSVTINGTQHNPSQRPFRCEPSGQYLLENCSYPAIHISSVGGRA